MDKNTIEIPQSNHSSIVLDTETQIKILIDTILFISNYLSPEIITDLESNDLKRIYDEIVNLNTLSANHLQFLIDEFKCKLCREELIEVAIHCNHSFCIKCIQDYINSQNSSQFLINIHPNQELIFTCPICRTHLSSIDINKIFPNDEKNTQINPSLIKCPNCNIFRSGKLFAPICKDKCLVCIKKCIFENIYQCEKCYCSYKNKDLLEMIFICPSCRKGFYFIGDNMQTLCNDAILCSNCANSAIEKSGCFCLKHLLSLDEKLEIARSLFKICDICGDEIHFKKFPRKSCCDKKVCYFCFKQKTNCPGCFNSISTRCREDISKFFSEILNFS
ncbi:hypothetical protein SteCoe_8544 [Stentor coeruleus]|uniref:RING-type domain-containing protein n=1 Tax=Stentor coeruleus TaxID=5963 RepID=A0A1R2CK66_9CILI|nr:hypothetical protein SteCoe_8544 [Stentor coeruleus]